MLKSFIIYYLVLMNPSNVKVPENLKTIVSLLYHLPNLIHFPVKFQFFHFYEVSRRACIFSRFQNGTHTQITISLFYVAA